MKYYATPNTGENESPMEDATKENWHPVKSNMYVLPKPSPAAEDHEEPRKKKKTPKAEEDNYWHSGLHGNKEEYEKYLIIKNRLEGRRWGRGKARIPGANIVSSRPLMRALLWIIFFINITKIFDAYAYWGIYQRPFVRTFLTYGLLSVILYWYFFRRHSTKTSFFGNFPINVQTIQSLLYWSFLLGWLASNLELELFKIWVPYIGKALEFFQVGVDMGAVMSMDLPQVPHTVQSSGFLVSTVSWILLVIGEVFLFVLSFFTDKA